uniref:Formate--tetrahydrofolate ligase n=1 Tax=uncultured bacterium Sargasso-2222818 TaxID=414118 RepID=A8QNL6_9BACT|nr:unknown [uncultured bacterium Sargasso-2222818]
MDSDINIARKANSLPISEIAKNLNIPEESIIPYGNNKAKIDYSFIKSLSNKKNGKLILVTAISPTPAGEGKTTTTVGLGDGLNKIGENTLICLREPSLGPCFGMKGGAAGGGYSQVIPMEDINLHFTGDFHAISSAHNLLSALVDNHIHWDNTLGFDVRRVSWKRVVDMNDRALRKVILSLGGVNNGFPREGGFDITVASEIMAIFCLAEDLNDLRRRIGNIVVGFTRKNDPITAKQINADGPVTALLKDAFMPNLVQTLENNPALIHGGPFANIAHGCNSVVATKTALKLADYVVTEAGFGADLGAEKFFNIKCRKSGLRPDAVVLVATTRALKMHGGLSKDNLNTENLNALDKGLCNLERHIRNIKLFGVNVVVAINKFHSDTQKEFEIIKNSCSKNNVNVFECNHWAEGGEGTLELANHVVHLTKNSESEFVTLYEDKITLVDKVRKICREIYSAEDIAYDQKVEKQFLRFQELYGDFPICIAKTQYSFSTDNNLLGAPENHKIPIKELRLSAGAEFIVVVCGEIMTMPGLPRSPAANQIFVNDEGNIEGLF